MINILLISDIEYEFNIKYPNYIFINTLINILSTSNIYIWNGNQIHNLSKNTIENIDYPHCINKFNIDQIVLFEPLPKHFMLSKNTSIYTSYFYFNYILEPTYLDLINLQLSDEIFINSIHYLEIIKKKLPLKNILIVNPYYEPDIPKIYNYNLHYIDKKYILLLDLNYLEINDTFTNIDSFLYNIYPCLNNETFLIINNNEYIISNKYLYSIINTFDDEFIFLVNHEHPLEYYPINVYLTISSTHIYNLDIIKYQYYGIPVIGLDIPYLKSWLINGYYLEEKINKWHDKLKIWHSEFTFKDLPQKFNLIKNKKETNQYQDKIMAQAFMLCNTNLDKFKNTIEFYFHRPLINNSKIGILQFTNNDKVRELNINYSNKWNYNYFYLPTIVNYNSQEFMKYYLEYIIKYLPDHEYLWIIIGDIYFINYKFSLDKICNPVIFEKHHCLISRNNNINTLVLCRSDDIINTLKDTLKDKDTLTWKHIIPNNVKIIPNQRLLYSEDPLIDSNYNYQSDDLSILLDKNSIIINYLDKLIEQSIYQIEYPVPNIVHDENNNEIIIINRYQLGYQDIITNYRMTLSNISILVDDKWESIYQTSYKIPKLVIEQDNKYGIFISESNVPFDFLLDKLCYCYKHGYHLYIGEKWKNKINDNYFIKLSKHHLIWNHSLKLEDMCKSHIDSYQVDNFTLIGKDTFIVSDPHLQNINIYNIWSKLKKCV